jgi:hypothetical protein
MPRPPVKKTLKLAEAQAYGETMGTMKAEAHFRELNKGQERSLKAHLGKFLDAMAAKVDPVEIAVVLSTTYVVHSVLLSSQTFIANLVKHQTAVFEGLAKVAKGDIVGGLLQYETGMTSESLAKFATGDIVGGVLQYETDMRGLAQMFGELPVIGQIFKNLASATSGGSKVTAKAGEAAAKIEKTEEQKIAEAIDSTELWLISFVIAYVVIRYGPALIKDMGGISGIATLLIGLV